MMVLFVSRHPGALQWARSAGVQFDRHVAHLDPDTVGAGDVVVGTLPVHLAARVCARGARYLHLSVAVPAGLRGIELSAVELAGLGATLQAFEVRAVPPGRSFPYKMNPTP